MDRRKFLTGIGAAAAVALAGCLGDDNERVELVEDYFEAIDEGNMDLADGLVHEDGTPPFESQEDIDIETVEELDREEVADQTDHDLADLEDEDETLVDARGMDETAYVYGDIETGADGDIDVYYRLVDEDGLWFIWEDLADADEEE